MRLLVALAAVLLLAGCAHKPGGILMAADVDPHEQFAEWGLERKEVEDTI